MYYNGDGVPQDDKTAVKWYRLAAEQGNSMAQAHVGSMYRMGQGVIQDNVYAHMWLDIASSNFDTNTGNWIGGLRASLAKLLTPSQFEKAQDLAHECVHKKYKGC